MRRLALAAALLLSGCDWGLGSDPSLPPPACAAGHERRDGACLLARVAVVIDGASDDWSQAPLLGANLQLALEPEAADGGGLPTLEVHGLVDPGAPVELRFAPVAGDVTPQLDRLLADGASVRWFKAGVDVTPPAGEATAWSFAWTADGFELSLPTSYLPFANATRVELGETAVSACFVADREDRCAQ